MSSQVANFASGIGVYDASLVGNPTLDVSAQVGTGDLSLNNPSGVNQYMVSNTAFTTPAVSAGNGISFSGWFYPSTSQTVGSTLFDISGTGVNSCSLYYYDASHIAGFFSGGSISSASVQSTVNISPGMWHFFCYTIFCNAQGQTLQSLYVDNSWNSATSYPATSSGLAPIPYVSFTCGGAGTASYIGYGVGKASNTTTYTAFNGKIDDFRFYNRVLSLPEVNVLYSFNYKSGVQALSIAAQANYDISYVNAVQIDLSGTFSGLFVTRTAQSGTSTVTTSSTVSCANLVFVNATTWAYVDTTVAADTSYSYTLTPYVMNTTGTSITMNSITTTPVYNGFFNQGSGLPAFNTSVAATSTNLPGWTISSGNGAVNICSGNNLTNIYTGTLPSTVTYYLDISQSTVSTTTIQQYVGVYQGTQGFVSFYAWPKDNSYNVSESLTVTLGGQTLLNAYTFPAPLATGNPYTAFNLPFSMSYAGMFSLKFSVTNSAFNSTGINIGGVQVRSQTTAGIGYRTIDPSGLSLYYPFDLNTTSGTLVYDCSAGFTGVADASLCGNTVGVSSLISTTPPPIIGTASVALDGSSGYITIGAWNMPPKATGSGFSITGWVYPVSGTSVASTLCTLTASTGTSVVMYLNNGAFDYSYNIAANPSGGTEFLTSSIGYGSIPNQWNFFAMTGTCVDGSNCTFTYYVNDVSLSTVNNAKWPNQNATPLAFTSNYLGGYPTGTATSLGFLKGSMDDFRVYNRCLTSQDVFALWSYGFANSQSYMNVVDPTGLGIYYPMDQGDDIMKSPPLPFGAFTVSGVIANGFTLAFTGATGFGVSYTFTINGVSTAYSGSYSSGFTFTGLPTTGINLWNTVVTASTLGGSVVSSTVPVFVPPSINGSSTGYGILLSLVNGYVGNAIVPDVSWGYTFTSGGSYSGSGYTTFSALANAVGALSVSGSSWTIQITQSSLNFTESVNTSVTVASSSFSSFSPANITGCMLWLDAADGATITSTGGNVTTWNDKSGSGNNFTGTNNPKTNTASMNGLNVMDVSSNNTSYFINSGFTFPNKSTVFAVGYVNSNNITSSNKWNQLVGDATTVNTYLEIGINNQTNNLWCNMGSGGGGGWNSATTSPSVNITNTPFMVEMTSDYTLGATGLTPYVNGTALNSVSAAYTAWSGGICVGGSKYVGAITQNWQGYVAEVLIYNTPLSTSNRQQIEGYLAWKWGLAGNLPAAHPYATSPPMMSITPMAITGSTFVNPTSIAGCLLWLDAADSTTISLSGSNVTAWNDKSSSALTFTQPTSGNRPTYATTSPNLQNGLPTIRFSAASSQFLGGGTTFNIGTNSWTIFTVFKTDDNSSSASLFNKSLLGSAANRLIMTRNSGSTFDCGIAGNQSNPLQLSNTESYTPNAYRIFCYTYARRAGKVYLYQNSSTTPVSASPGVDTATLINNTYNMVVGAYNDSSGTLYHQTTGAVTAVNFLTGNICEIIGYATPNDMTDAQRQQIEGYLAWKWGLVSNLPATHLYKNSSPSAMLLWLDATSSSSIIPSYPLSIAGCNLWLDAADSGTISLSGSNVTAWNDKSSSALTFTQATSGNRPTYATNSQNGLSTMRFAAASSQYLAGGTTFNIGTNSWTIFVVFKTDDNSSSASLFNKSLYGGAVNRLMMTRNAGSTFDCGVANTAILSNPETYTANSYRMFCYTYARRAGKAYLYQNGSTNPVTSSPGVDTATLFNNNFNMVVGAYNDSAGGLSPPMNFLTGNICEILSYATPDDMTDYQRQQIEGYLATKWGLQSNLPAGHPYATKQLTNFVWKDRSGSSYDMIGYNAPKTGTSTINNLNVIDLSTNSTSYFSNANSVLTSALSVFAVGYSGIDTTTGGARLIDTGDTNAHLQVSNYSNTLLVQFGNGTNAVSSTLAGYPVTTPTLMEGSTTGQGGTQYGYSNGTLLASNTCTYYTPTSTLRISTSISNQQWRGYVGEILMYSNSLSDINRTQVEGYLAWKWGLQTKLPFTHLYYNNSPSLDINNYQFRIKGVSSTVPTTDAVGATLTNNNNVAMSNDAYRGWVLNFSSSTTTGLLIPNSYSASISRTFWLRMNQNLTTTSAAARLFTTGSTDIFLYNNAGAMALAIYIQSGSNSYVYLPYWLSGWNFYAITISGTTTSVYMNGLLYQTITTNAYTSDSGNTAIGLHSNLSSSLYNYGVMDDARQYNYTLTPQQIQQIYLATATTTNAPTISNYQYQIKALSSAMPTTDTTGVFNLTNNNTVTVVNDATRGYVLSFSGSNYLTASNYTPMWVIGGSSTNSLAWSMDGKNWNGLGTTYFSTQVRSVKYGGGIWVAAGQGSNPLAYSYDGKTWTGVTGTTLFSTMGNGLEYNGSMWVATAQGSSTSTYSIAYSMDGINWNGAVLAQGSNIFTNCFAVAFGANKWVAVGTATTSNHYFAYSYDGKTWFGNGQQTFTSAGGFYSIAYNGSLFVAGGSGNGVLCYSTDGITWQAGTGTSTTAGQVSGIAYGNGKWIAVTNASPFAYSSTDGKAWTSISGFPSVTSCQGISFGGNMFIVGTQGTYNIYYSTDGATFQASTLALGNYGFWAGIGMTTQTTTPYATRTFWAKSTSSTPGNLVSSNNWLIDCSGSVNVNSTLNLMDASGSTKITDPTARGTGWNHYAMTVNGTNTALYVNGASVATGTLTNPFVGDRSLINIGADPWASKRFTGYLDDIRQYNFVLSPSQISSLYTASTTGTIADGGTINRYISYKSHTFTSNGTFTVTGGSLVIDFMLIGGGGCGGGFNQLGSGGGAGGVVIVKGYTLSAGTYNVVIGKGGSPGTTAGDMTFITTTSNLATNSTFAGFTALAGGAGAGQSQDYNLSIATPTPYTTYPIGGCGAGGCRYNPFGTATQPSQSQPSGSFTVTNYGYAGGNFVSVNSYFNPGGGGGAGGKGGDGSQVSGSAGVGVGGAAITNDFQTGTMKAYAGGGGSVGQYLSVYNASNGGGVTINGSTVTVGGNGVTSGASVDGTTNTGSGGGANAYIAGGYGAAGVCIIRYRVY